MISRFEVKDFKCHEGINTFKFPGLTIVSGTNNSGKSSLLQAVYILTQNKTNVFPMIVLNEVLKLGSFSDVLNKEKRNNDTIEFCIVFEKSILKKDNLDFLRINFVYTNPSKYNNILFKEGAPILEGINFEYQFMGCENNSINLRLEDKKESNFYCISGEEHGYCRIFGLTPEPIIFLDIQKDKRKLCSKKFEILCKYTSLINAENFKYLKAYRVDDYRETDFMERNSIGIGGEYTAEIIANSWDSCTFFKNESYEYIKFSKLFDEWVTKLLGKEFKVRSKKIDKEEFKVVVKDVRYDIEFNLRQIGFGISQIIPILTLILISKKDDVILIENPEIHLHPKLQADLVDLFIFALMNGRKLIIETHSEHIINRLRLRIKENNELINKVNIYFFEKDEEVVKYQQIEVDRLGKIQYWPQNFFDQSYFDLMGLIKK